MTDLPTDFDDLDAGHTAAHNDTNEQVNINSRAVTVQSISHTASGALVLDANDGWIAVVDVEDNITGLTLNNFGVGQPFLLFLKGDGVTNYTADLSAINLDVDNELNDSLDVQADSQIQIAFVKLPGGEYWAPAGVLDYIVAVANDIFPRSSSVKTYTGAFSTTHAYTMPATVNSGDILELYVCTQNGGAPDVTPSTPAGWTQIYAVTHPSNTAYVPKVTLFRKVATGTEGGTNVTVTWSTSIRAYGCAVAWGAVDTTTPADSAVSSTTGFFTNPNPASVTPVTDRAAVVVFAAGNIPGGGTITGPTGWTQVINTGASDRSVWLGYKIVSPAALTDPAAFVWAAGNSLTKVHTLRPA